MPAMIAIARSRVHRFSSATGALCWLLGCVLCASSCPPMPVAAQSLREEVRKHVEQGMDRARKRQKRRKAQRRGRPRRARTDQYDRSRSDVEPSVAPREPAPVETSVQALTTSPAPAPTPSNEPSLEPAAAAPVLPQRLIPDQLQLDVEVGGGYRGWFPQQFEHVAVHMAHYFTWNISVRARLFKLVALREGYYESNALAPPRTREAVVLAQVGSHVPKAAWLLGELGFPFLEVWEPTIRYEARAFRTSARPDRAVCVVPRSGGPADLSSCATSSEALRVVSGFETLVVGVRYRQDREPGLSPTERAAALPPLFFGVGLMAYEKPYQLTVGGSTLDDVLFDARFLGAGLAFGTKVGGGIGRFAFDVHVQVGLGEVSLTEDLSIGDVIPDDWLLGYVQGNALLSVAIPLWAGLPTVVFRPALSLGGAGFYLLDTVVEQGEGFATPSVNWDLLWSARAALVLYM